MTLVGAFVASARRPLALSLARLVSKLGDAWIYPFLGIACLVFGRWRGLQVILVATLNVLLLQAIYPYIKRLVSRPRPFQISRSLHSAYPPLDEHSFPSGHIMTLTGAFTPILLVFPSTTTAALTLWLAMAWARIATAHHFLSDIVGGAIIALIVAYPVSVFLLHHLQAVQALN
jgi:undecaprenyl-diphosphatase